MRIFLTGFMGSGKSTLGKQLATELGLQFIDLDREIESRFGKDIPAIFATDGEAHFRDLEKQVLNECLDADDFVMACGGGTPCFSDNMDKMNEAGITVYLKLSTDGLFERLTADGGKRPVLQGRTSTELWTWIHELLQDREPDYLRAHYKVKAKDLRSKDLAEFIRLYEMPEASETVAAAE
jgi:shikimate kinase